MYQFWWFLEVIGFKGVGGRRGGCDLNGSEEVSRLPRWAKLCRAAGAQIVKRESESLKLIFSW
jgi:hypothetical protein